MVEKGIKEGLAHIEILENKTQKNSIKLMIHGQTNNRQDLIRKSLSPTKILVSPRRSIEARRQSKISPRSRNLQTLGQKSRTQQKILTFEKSKEEDPQLLREKLNQSVNDVKKKQKILKQKENQMSGEKPTRNSVSKFGNN